MDCTKVGSMISLYIDNQLSAEDKKLFEDHIASCESCREELEFMQTIISNVGDLNDEKELPSDFHKNLMVKIDNVNSTRTKTRKKIAKLSNFRRYYTGAAAVFVVVLIFGVIGIANLNKYAQDEYMPKEAKYERAEEAKESAPRENKAVAYDISISNEQHSELAKSEDYQATTDSLNDTDSANDGELEQLEVRDNEVSNDKMDDNKSVPLEKNENKNISAKIATTRDDTYKDDTDTNISEKPSGISLTADTKKSVSETSVQEEKKNNNQWIIGSIIIVGLILVLGVLLINRFRKTNIK